jgi:hypothetical protein
MPGANAILDPYARAFDPFSSTVSTLMKIKADVVLEDSGAYRQTLVML